MPRRWTCSACSPTRRRATALVGRYLPLAEHLAAPVRRSRRGARRPRAGREPGAGARDRSVRPRPRGRSSRRSPRSRSWARSAGTSATGAGRSGSPGACRRPRSRSTGRMARLWQRLGRSPTIAEIAAEVDLPEETVLEAMDAVQAYSTVVARRHRWARTAATSAGDMLGDGRPVVSTPPRTGWRSRRPSRSFPSGSGASSTCASSRT